MLNRAPNVTPNGTPLTIIERPSIHPSMENNGNKMAQNLKFQIQNGLLRNHDGTPNGIQDEC